jgi:hypothetical protein
MTVTIVMTSDDIWIKFLSIANWNVNHGPLDFFFIFDRSVLCSILPVLFWRTTDHLKIKNKINSHSNR